MNKSHLLKKLSLGIAAMALVAPLFLGATSTTVNARRRYHYHVTRRFRRRPVRRRARRHARRRSHRSYYRPRVVKVRPFKGTATSYCETVTSLNRHDRRHFSHINIGKHFKVVANVYGRHNIIACKIIYYHHVLYADPNAINSGVNAYGI